ncbi:MAG: glycosyltransferase family 2 protein [Betaproteobacteria bacterium]
MEPVISVIIVVLNGEKTIRRAIESVLCQTYAQTELLIVDGGSSDQTLAIVEPYIGRTSYFVSKRDNGIYDAMNHALSQCKGDWCLFLGCDDVLIDCFHRVAPRLVNGQHVYYGNVIFRSSGDIYCGRFSKAKLACINICHQAIFYPKSSFAKPYDTEYRLLADYKYNIELWGSGALFKYLGYVIADYNDLGSAAPGDKRFSADKVRILRANLGWGPALIWRLIELALPLYRRLRRAGWIS